MNLAVKIVLKNTYRFFSEKNYRTFLILAAKLGNKKRYLKGATSFNDFKVNYVDALSLVWQYNEIFKENYYLFNTNNKEPLIYDCGSNIGTSCLYFKQKYPNCTIKAFEADSSITAILKQNIAENNLTNVEINNTAIWIDDLGIEFSFDGADGASIYSEQEQKIKVSSVRLKNLLDKETQNIDFLKMDIEGAEKKVIVDCNESLKKINNLFIEYHDFSGHTQDLDAILSVLTNNNFKYYIINEHYQNAPFTALNENKNLQLNIFAKQIN